MRLALAQSALALSLLCAPSTLAQQPTKDPRTGSRVPSITIQQINRNTTDYEFSLHSHSTRDITAFAVLFVPSGVPEKNSRFICQRRCSGTSQVADLAKPAIPALQSATIHCEASKARSGAVIVEAALFADGTYEGSERAAAFLISRQLGNQEEFDRIVATVEKILAQPESGPTQHPSQPSKATRLQSALNALSSDLAPPMLTTFDRWFPNLQDCERRFPRIMEHAEQAEKKSVEEKLQPYLTQEHPELAQWWQATQEILAPLGCADCAEKTAYPNPPATSRTISVGCKSAVSSDIPSATVSLELADDAAMYEDSGDDSDSAKLASDGTNPSADDDALAMNDDPEIPVDEGPRVVSTDRGGPSASSGSASQPLARLQPGPYMSRPRIILGSGVTVVGSSPLRSRQFAGALGLRLMPDSALYPQYFRYVRDWDQYLSFGGQPATPGDGQSDPPTPAQLNRNEQHIVRDVAYEFDAAWKDILKIEFPGGGYVRNDIAAGSNAGVTLVPRIPPIYALWGPPRLAEESYVRQRSAAREKAVADSLNKLRVLLGQTAFNSLDTYVHQIYHATPARVVAEPLPENTMDGRYLRYIASLDEYSAGRGNAPGTAVDDLQGAAAMLADELQILALNNKDAEAMRRIADGYAESEKALRDQRRGQGASGRLQASSDSIISDNQRRLPTEQYRQNLTLYMHRLATELSEPGFTKVQDRIHDLYKSEVVLHIVPLTAEPETKASEIVKRAN